MPVILQNHYVLAVHDLRANVEFFGSLGFEVVAEPPGWTFVRRDRCMVMLGECRDALPPSKLGDHGYFGYLRVDDVDAFHASLRAKGVPALSPLETKPWEMREFSVATPEGHRLTIGQWVGAAK